MPVFGYICKISFNLLYEHQKKLIKVGDLAWWSNGPMNEYYIITKIDKGENSFAGFFIGRIIRSFEPTYGRILII